MNYYTGVWKKYAQFSGRARRAEYWYFALFNFIVTIVLAIPYYMGIGMVQNGNGGGWVLTLPYFAYCLAAIVPSLAVTVRRLHDINKSGWWIFIALVPFIGWIWLLVLTIMEGTSGENQYGPDPRGASVAATATA